MDTDKKYLNDDFYVVMAGETTPEEFRLSGKEDAEPTRNVEYHGARANHVLGEKPEVDGWVTFYDPRLLENGEPFKHGTIPFRSIEKDGLWFCFPENEKGNKHPVWKWQNPDEDPHKKLTLKPSIGLFSGAGFHCWIKEGEIEWV